MNVRNGARRTRKPLQVSRLTYGHEKGQSLATRRCRAVSPRSRSLLRCGDRTPEIIALLENRLLVAQFREEIRCSVRERNAVL